MGFLPLDLFFIKKNANNIDISMGQARAQAIYNYANNTGIIWSCVYINLPLVLLLPSDMVSMV